MAAISYNSIAEAIYRSLAGKSPEEQARLLPDIVAFLARRRLLSKSDEILKRLQKIADRKEGRMTVLATSRFPLEERTRQSIREALKKRYGANNVTIDERTDEKLLGGFRLEIDDDVIDLSLKKKVKKLQEHLTKSAQ